MKIVLVKSKSNKIPNTNFQIAVKWFVGQGHHFEINEFFTTLGIWRKDSVSVEMLDIIIELNSKKVDFDCAILLYSKEEVLGGEPPANNSYDTILGKGSINIMYNPNAESNIAIGLIKHEICHFLCSYYKVKDTVHNYDVENLDKLLKTFPKFNKTPKSVDSIPIESETIVKLNINKSYPSPNLSKRPINIKPEVIVLHCTDGKYPTDLEWLTNRISKVSSHYFIAPNGQIFQLVDEKNSAWSQGVVKSPTSAIVRERFVSNPNSYCISIENSKKIGEVWVKSQYDSLVLLVKQIAKENKIPLNRRHIIGHNEIRNDKECPSRDPKFIDKLLKNCLNQ